jgi:hypothetical protein
VELLDGPETDPLEAADDDMALPAHAVGSLHIRMVPDLGFYRIAGVFRLEARFDRPAGETAGGIHVRSDC